MTCNKCLEKTLVSSTTTYYTNLHGCKVIIENVPCFKCQNCGHELFPVLVMVKIEKLLNMIQTYFSVCVIDYSKAA